MYSYNISKVRAGYPAFSAWTEAMRRHREGYEKSNKVMSLG